MTKTPDEDKQPKESSGTPWLPIFLAAVAFGLLYAVVSVVTYVRAGEPGMSETVWSRLIFVLHGLEVMAFTAVGWIFGREVHRGESKQAKQEATDAKDRAAGMSVEAHQARLESAAARERAATAETKGWRLAEAVRATFEPTAARSGDFDTLGGEEDGGYERSPAGERSPQPVRSGVRDLANSLFPPS